jgi:hypothetical protein
MSMGGNWKMTAAEKNERSAEASPLLTARMGGLFWLGTIVAGAAALIKSSATANLIAITSYLAATVFVYLLLKLVSRAVSLIAAFCSLVGCTMAVLIIFRITRVYINPLAFFGLHCLGVGYLIARSSFIPRIVGVLMMFGGLGWLTFMAPPLASDLAPYNLLPGMLGETTMTLWLLLKGVNVERWKEQAHASLRKSLAPT